MNEGQPFFANARYLTIGKDICIFRNTIGISGGISWTKISTQSSDSPLRADPPVDMPSNRYLGRIRCHDGDS